jgi:hypothetical protein
MGAERTRQDTDPLLKLDVRWLNRIGALQPGAVAYPSWTCRGEPSGNIVTRMDANGGSLILDYATRVPGETEWTPWTEAVALESTPCHYGGERVWFLCPGCHTRRAVLFSVSGIFRCRRCHGLAYSSTREDAHERSIRRCQALQKRLGGGGYGVPIWHIPSKPKGMHWTTYERLVREFRHELHRQDGFFDLWIARREALLRQL